MIDQSLDPRRKRILYRSQHRGSREADLLLGGFAAAHLADLDDGQLVRFEAILDQLDGDLVDWILARRAMPADLDHDVMAMIKAFANRR